MDKKVAARQLEGAAHQHNLERTVKDSQRRERAFGLAAGHAGHAFVQRHLDRLVAFVRDARAFGRPTRQTYKMRSLNTWVFDLIVGVPDEDIALAALSGALNATWMPPKKNDDGTLKDKGVARAQKETVGAEIERAARRHHLETRHPSLLKKVERATSYKQTLAARLELEAKLLRDKGVKYAWGKLDRFWVGAWGMDCCIQALKDVFVLCKEGKDTVLAINPRAWGVAERMATQQMLRRSPRLPTLDPPEPWTWFTNDDGIPFLSNCRDPDAAKDAILSGKMRPHMDAVSFLQAVPFRIDGYVLDFLSHLATRDVVPLVGLSRRRRRDRGPLGVLDWDIKQAQILRNESFYTERACEWRGRVEALPYFNYARDDYVRALFRFAHGATIGERGIYWLKVSTANCYGGAAVRTEHVKTFDERVKWVDEHIDRIRELVKDPFGGLNWPSEFWLARASDPFQFLSHARELVACRDNPEFITTLPLPLDASNSGAQHYSVLGRDPEGARLTNIVDDGGKPNDLYGEVAGRVRNRLANILATASPESDDYRRAAWWLPRIDRKRIKSVVVPYMYGQGEARAQTTVFNTLAEYENELVYEKGRKGKGKKKKKRVQLPKEYRKWVAGTDSFDDKWRPPERDDIPKGYLKWFTEIVHGEIGAALPSVPLIRNFIGGIAGALAARKVKSTRARALTWTSLSWVPIQNEYLEPDVRERTVYLGNKGHTHLVAGEYLPTLREGKCRLSAPPNVIHSLEASHLVFVALACEKAGIPLVTVHDCFATLGCHVDDLREIWLEELRKMYGRENLLQEIYDDARKALGPNATLPLIPKRGTLSLKKLNGRYPIG